MPWRLPPDLRWQPDAAMRHRRIRAARVVSRMMCAKALA
jgi:hypothetical protein